MARKPSAVASKALQRKKRERDGRGWTERGRKHKKKRRQEKTRKLTEDRWDVKRGVKRDCQTGVISWNIDRKSLSDWLH